VCPQAVRLPHDAELAVAPTWPLSAFRSALPPLTPGSQPVMDGMPAAVVPSEASIAEGVHPAAPLAARCSIRRSHLADRCMVPWLRQQEHPLLRTWHLRLGRRVLQCRRSCAA